MRHLRKFNESIDEINNILNILSDADIEIEDLSSFSKNKYCFKIHFPTGKINDNPLKEDFLNICKEVIERLYYIGDNFFYQILYYRLNQFGNVRGPFSHIGNNSIEKLDKHINSLLSEIQSHDSRDGVVFYDLDFVLIRID